MNDWIVQCEGGVTLIGGGAVQASDVNHALTIAPCLVAADGGGDRALAMDLAPQAVIGDLDSLSGAGRIALADRLHRVAEQDSTDFGKCLRLVSARFYLGLGFTGLRLDHTLSALSEVAARPDQTIVLIAEDDIIFRAPPVLWLDLPAGERLSLFPFGPVSGRSEGLRWPIDGIDFAPAGRIGTSNEVAGEGPRVPVRIEVTGPMLVLLPKSYLAEALDALAPRSARGG